MSGIQYIVVIKHIFTNGFLLLVPIFIWNLVFASKLPPAYQPQNFNNDIPLFTRYGENIFRSIIFMSPIFFKIGISAPLQKQGLILYIIGVTLYFSSWLALIYSPSSWWSTNIIGFSSPAFTSIIWLIGLSLMVDDYYFHQYSKWHYIVPASFFALFHIHHSVFVYKSNY